MLQKCRKMLRNEKGLTLIELLAVVVILGIIAAIAIPSIGGLIDNSKKDAHVANAQQMASAARLAITGLSDATGSYNISLEYLQDNDFIETMEDPDGGSYSQGTGQDPMNDTTGSYVVVSSGKVTAVKLVNGTRGVQLSTGTPKGPVLIEDLKRQEVRAN